MRFKSVLLLSVFYFLYSFAYASFEIIDTDEIDRYVRIAFSSKEFLAYHEKLIEKGYVWFDIPFCNQVGSGDEDPHVHWVQMGFRYKKGKEVVVINVDVKWNSKTGKAKVSDISLDDGKEEKPAKADDGKMGENEIDLSK